MSHPLQIKKESHFGLKKKFYDLGYSQGIKGIEPQERASVYYMKGFREGKKTAEKVSKYKTIDNWV